MSETSRIQFKINGFKRSKINNISSSDVQFDSSTLSNDVPREFISYLNDDSIQANKTSISKHELYIPVQPNTHHNVFKRAKTFNQPGTSLDPEVNNLNNDLKQIAIEETKANNELWNNRNENETIHLHTITNDVISVKDEEDIENADYDQVPIEEFGIAVLRGMGYNENIYVNTLNKKQMNVFNPEIRPLGLGLGADRQIHENLHKLKRNLKESGIDENNDLCFEKGAFVIIKKGSYRNFYGTIESIDNNLNNIIVTITIDDTKNESISISQYDVQLVTEKVFLKYSKYVNKSQNDTSNN